MKGAFPPKVHGGDGLEPWAVEHDLIVDFIRLPARLTFTTERRCVGLRRGGAVGGEKYIAFYERRWGQVGTVALLHFSHYHADPGVRRVIGFGAQVQFQSGLVECDPLVCPYVFHAHDQQIGMEGSCSFCHQLHAKGQGYDR